MEGAPVDRHEHVPGESPPRRGVAWGSAPWAPEATIEGKLGLRPEAAHGQLQLDRDIPARCGPPRPASSVLRRAASASSLAARIQLDLARFLSQAQPLDGAGAGNQLPSLPQQLAADACAP